MSGYWGTGSSCKIGEYQAAPGLFCETNSQVSTGIQEKETNVFLSTDVYSNASTVFDSWLVSAQCGKPENAKIGFI